MVKVRMNTADVAAEVKCLRRLIGMRCANVYDISPKTYLFKLMNSSGITESGESEKVLLLMESGVRLHTTAYVRDKSTTPSGFTLKLRKHIRTRRLEDVRQLGYDRIILFQFGLGANAHYVILELYAQGNILLTDSDFIVMTLLRSHRDDDKGLAIMSRHRYPIEACRIFERTSFTKLQLALTCTKSSVGNDCVVVDEGGNNDNMKSKEQGKNKNKKMPDSNNKVSDGGRTNKSTLKIILGEVLGYGPALSEHIILDAGLLPNMKIGNENDGKIDDDLIRALSQAITRFEDWLTDVISGQKVPEGYILMQNKVNGKKENISSQETISNKVYDEFCPILLNQFRSREYMKFQTFDAALDEFYSKIESQRVEQQQKVKEGTAVQKLHKIRLDQENRVHVLKKEVDHCIQMGELIEYNLEDVDAAILAVRVALANGMDWQDLARMVKEEKKSGNPVAGLIDKLHLERNCITLLLSNNLDEMDEDEITCPVDKVEVDLALSAHSNARRWFELKKKQENKQEKTVSAHEKAFKAAERKTRLQLAQEKTVAAISHMRKVHWFEKFSWFVSSENYLVISGRDAQQNEMIVKRYMSKGDLYIHADLHGASSTVIKNHKADHPVPPLTLNQAGCFTVCQSKAWDSKIVTSAWWVYPHQVSKTAPTGEYLTVGSFMIRGKKNFLPPHPLVMGFGILFRLDESSLASHLNERRVRGEDEGLPDVEEGDSLKGQIVSESGEDNPNEEVTGENVSSLASHLNERRVRGEDEGLPDVEEGDSLEGQIASESGEDNPNEEVTGEDESSLASHLNERRVRGEDEGLPDVEEGDSIKGQIVSELGEDNPNEKVTGEVREPRHLLSTNFGDGISEVDNSFGESPPDFRMSDPYGDMVRDVTNNFNNVRDEHSPITNKMNEPSISPQLEVLIDRALGLGPAKVLSISYGLDTQLDQTEDQSLEEKKGTIREKPYMSKAERRKLKKGPKNSDDTKVGVHEKEETKESNILGTQPDKNVEDQRPAPPKITRGQKGKLKKMKEKYAEQDDEERKIRMALLASSGRAVKNEKELQGEEKTAGKEIRSTTGQDDSSKICYKCKKVGHLSRDCQEYAEETDRSKEVTTKHENGEAPEDLPDADFDKAASEMDKVIIEEDDIHEIGEEEKGKLNDLDYLTGNPLPNDILLYAVPVCGPYNALQTYKYRVKLTPGTAKKGKAAKTAMNLFSHIPEATNREKELMKACTDPELVAAIISNSKITAPGLTQLKQKQKKGKKSGK